MIEFLKKERFSARGIALTGITAAAYVAATWMVAPLSYGPVQFRFSEIMILLAFLDIRYGPGLILGCAIANLFSPFAVLDVIIGTTGTICTVTMIAKTKSLFLASLWPTVFCVFVGAELCFLYKMPFVVTCLSVMFGEFVVVTCLGYPLFRTILKNHRLMSVLKLHQE